jgi:hypothetical protein
MRILMSGMVAGVPGQGGAASAVLQWVLGLRRLGHDVLLAEPVKDVTPDAEAYFASLMGTFELEGAACLLGPERSVGLSRSQVARFAGRADILLNVAGMLQDPELRDAPARRVYVDLDPAFTQLWHAVDGIDMGFDGHTHFVTVGLNVGQPDCPVPTCGVEWVATLPPVLLERWPVEARLVTRALTTVANWRGYGSVEHAGTFYGQKAHSWRPLASLPTLTSQPLIPALAIHPAEVDDLALLREYGWCLLSPSEVAATPAAYEAFLRGSWAEIGIAKSGYVLSRSGWFSDRSACYLAAGRPVIAQDTGFSAHLPTGDGLLTFTTVEEAASAIEEVARDYARHRAAARVLAEEWLDSDVVLGRLLDGIVADGGR